jgi:hypothetical protein
VYPPADSVLDILVDRLAFIQLVTFPDLGALPLPYLRVTIATKRVNGFFREIEFLENRFFDPLPTTYINYPTFNVSHVLRGTKNASKD